MKLANLVRGNDRVGLNARLAVCASLVATSAGAGVLSLVGAASAAPLPGGFTLSPVLEAGKTTPICDVLDNEPDYSDVACSNGVSAYYGASETVLAATMVLEDNPLTTTNQAPFHSTTFVVQLGVNNDHVASFGINGKLTNDRDVLYAGCAGGPVTFSRSASSALADGTITVAQQGAYWLLTFNVERSRLVQCGILANSSMTPFMGTSQAGPLDNINKDFFFGDKVDFSVSNQPPTADDETIEVLKDSTATTVDVLTGDTDPDGDPLAVTAVGNASHGTAALTAGAVTYTPDAGYVGTDSFTYQISDGRGGTATGTVNVTVVEPGDVNEPPVADDEHISVLQDSSATTVDVLTGDTDPDGDVLSVQSVGLASNGTAALAGGVVTYTPNAGYSGNDSFDYVVTDGYLTDTGTVTITVVPVIVNGPPVADDETLVVPQDSGPTAVDVLDGDTDPDGDTLSVISVGTAANGTVVLSDDGVVTYTPAAGYSGPDSFTYTVTDGAEAATATVRVTVTPTQGPQNRPPTAVDDPANTAYATPVDVTVLANDSDPDGDPLVVTGVTEAAHGVVSLAQPAVEGVGSNLRRAGALHNGAAHAGVFTYTPAAGYSGLDTFTYSISDGRGGVGTAFVRVNVGEPPVVVIPDNPTPAEPTPSASPSASPTVEPTKEPTAAPSPSASPIGGVTSPEPATGSPSQSPLPTLPFEEPDEEEPAAEEPAEELPTLPFTGSSTDMLLGLGAGLSVLGLMLVLTGRSRRAAE